MFPMWIRLLTTLLIVALAGCVLPPAMQQADTVAMQTRAADKAAALTEAQRYFLEVALGSEFGNTDPFVRRWERPVRLFIDGEQPAALLEEAHAVVDELRALVPHLDMRWVESAKAANVVIYFGPYKKYAAKYAPRAQKVLRRNWGFFRVRWVRGRGGIKSASMYVDTHRAHSGKARRHLLREELTQLLGLMVDSRRHSDSIFYQHWSTTTEYSALDREVIKILYDKRMHSGMDEAAIRALWRESSDARELQPVHRSSSKH